MAFPLSTERPASANVCVLVFGNPVNVVFLPFCDPMVTFGLSIAVRRPLQIRIEPGTSLRAHVADVGAGERRGRVAEGPDVEPLRARQARVGACRLRDVEREVDSPLEEVHRRPDRAGLRERRALRRRTADRGEVRCSAPPRREGLRSAASGRRRGREAGDDARAGEVLRPERVVQRRPGLDDFGRREGNAGGECVPDLAAAVEMPRRRSSCRSPRAGSEGVAHGPEVGDLSRACERHHAARGAVAARVVGQHGVARRRRTRRDRARRCRGCRRGRAGRRTPGQPPVGAAPSGVYSV